MENDRLYPASLAAIWDSASLMKVAADVGLKRFSMAENGLAVADSPMQVLAPLDDEQNRSWVPVSMTDP